MPAPAEGIPAYTRIGSFAARPVTASTSARLGPRPRKTLPWPPTDSHVEGEAGEAERSGTLGWKMPFAVRVFIRSACRRKNPMPPRRITLEVRK